MHRIFLRSLELSLAVNNLSQNTVTFLIRCYPLLHVQTLYTDVVQLVALIGIVNLWSQFTRLSVDWVVGRRSFLNRLVEMPMAAEMTIAEAT